jgi:hyperosmotically inducible periplasmic protein
VARQLLDSNKAGKHEEGHGKYSPDWKCRSYFVPGVTLCFEDLAGETFSWRIACTLDNRMNQRDWSRSTTMNQRHVRTFHKRLAALVGSIGFVLAYASAQTAPDNTRANKGDQNKSAVTADKQKMNESDRKLTQQIRKAVIADKSLSTYAHNVKIVSQNGMVTLKGPVRSDEEKHSIVAKAVEVAGGADKVTDQMTVAPSAK